MRTSFVIGLGMVASLALAIGARAALTPADAFAVIDQKLRTGEWEAARDLALGQIEDARGSLRAAYLGGAVARLALTEAGSGRTADAVWHWYVAQNLDRGAISRQQLASFGEAGAVLARHPLRQPGELPSGLTVYRADDPASGVRPPRTMAGESPTFSSAAGRVPLPKGLHGEAVVDADGHLDAPVVIGGAVPGVIWEALEALHDWRYEPARKDGEAVAAFRELRINPPQLRPIPDLVRLAPEDAAAAA